MVALSVVEVDSPTVVVVDWLTVVVDSLGAAVVVLLLLVAAAVVAAGVVVSGLASGHGVRSEAAVNAPDAQLVVRPRDAEGPSELNRWHKLRSPPEPKGRHDWSHILQPDFTYRNSTLQPCSTQRQKLRRIARTATLHLGGLGLQTSPRHPETLGYMACFG